MRGPEGCPAGPLGWEEAQEPYAHPGTAPRPSALDSSAEKRELTAALLLKSLPSQVYFFRRMKQSGLPWGPTPVGSLRGWALLAGSGAPGSCQVPWGAVPRPPVGQPASEPGRSRERGGTHRQGQQRGHAVGGAAQQEGPALLEGHVSAHLLQQQPQHLGAEAGLYRQRPPQGAGVAGARRVVTVRPLPAPAKPPTCPPHSAPARGKWCPDLRPKLTPPLTPGVHKQRASGRRWEGSREHLQSAQHVAEARHTEVSL